MKTLEADLMDTATATAPASTAYPLSLTRVFDAPPALVFRLWSDPARVKEWWHPASFKTSVFDMDFREGGSYRFAFASPEKSASAHGVYREIVAPHRIVMSFQWDHSCEEPDRPTLITVTFEPHGAAQTRLTFHQEPFVSEAERDSHGQGWGQVLDAFAEELAGARS